MRTHDLDEAVEAAGRIFVMHSARGSASALCEAQTGDWRRGQTMVFFVGHETQLSFDAQCLQKSVRLDMEKLEALCARLLGRPLDQPLRFAQRPFSDELGQAWQRALAYGQANESGSLAFAPAVKAAFDQFLMTLLLHHHPHNFSDDLSEGVQIPAPGVVRRAERFMADNADSPITVSEVAAHLDVSLRSLQVGFRRWRNTTPSAFFRQVRLQRVREALLCSDGQSTVTMVALRYGFAHLGRFSAYYRSTFGEPPNVTLRRGRSSRGRA